MTSEIAILTQAIEVLAREIAGWEKTRKAPKELAARIRLLAAARSVTMAQIVKAPTKDPGLEYVSVVGRQLKDILKEIFQKSADRYNSNISVTARALGISRNKVYTHFGKIGLLDQSSAQSASAAKAKLKRGNKTKPKTLKLKMDRASTLSKMTASEAGTRSKAAISKPVSKPKLLKRPRISTGRTRR